jgi:hypothetical protein
MQGPLLAKQDKHGIVVTLGDQTETWPRGKSAPAKRLLAFLPNRVRNHGIVFPPVRGIAYPFQKRVAF